MKDVLLIAQITNWITLDVLLSRRLISHSDIQEAIGRAREVLPKDGYTPAVADILNIMEQTYHAGRYHSPIARPGEPQL